MTDATESSAALAEREACLGMMRALLARLERLPAMNDPERVLEAIQLEVRRIGEAITSIGLGLHRIDRAAADAPAAQEQGDRT